MVTVCAPNSGKWQALVEALNHYDKDDLIFEVVKNTSDIRNYLREPFITEDAWEMILRQFETKIELDHALPENLKLLEIEEEVFYILHFACYTMNQLTEGYCDIPSWDEAIYDLRSVKINRQQTVVEIKENLCEKVLDCTAINIVSTKDIPTWKDCHRNDTNVMHQNWCKHCTDLSKCLVHWSLAKDQFLQFIVNTFYTWRKYHNKRNIIDSSISTYSKNYKPSDGHSDGPCIYFCLCYVMLPSFSVFKQAVFNLYFPQI